jgi:hypothetical protein
LVLGCVALAPIDNGCLASCQQSRSTVAGLTRSETVRLRLGSYVRQQVVAAIAHVNLVAGYVDFPFVGRLDEKAVGPLFARLEHERLDLVSVRVVGRPVVELKTFVRVGRRKAARVTRKAGVTGTAIIERAR